MKIEALFTKEEVAQHATKLHQYFALTDKRDLAKEILRDEMMKLNGDFDVAIQAATLRLRQMC